MSRSRVPVKQVLEVYPLSGCYKVIVKKDGKSVKEFWKIEKLLKRYLNRDNRENFKFTKAAHKDMSKNVFTSSILITNLKFSVKKKAMDFKKGSFLQKENHYQITTVEDGIAKKIDLFEKDFIKWYNDIDKNIIFSGIKKPGVLDRYGDAKFIDKYT